MCSKPTGQPAAASFHSPDLFEHLRDLGFKVSGYVGVTSQGQGTRSSGVDGHEAKNAECRISAMATIIVFWDIDDYALDRNRMPNDKLKLSWRVENLPVNPQPHYLH